jgi:superfamily II DNA or RNA helicase
MSVRVELDKLTREQLFDIKKYLMIEQKQNFIPYANPFLREKFAAEKQYVLMFTISADEKFIHLPYAFACKLLGEKQNQFPFREINFKFTGELRDGQISIVTPANETLDKTGSVLLASDTATGKTVMSVYLSSLRHVPVLVMFKLGILIDQWKNSYLEFTNAKVCTVDKGKSMFTYNPYDESGNFIPPDVFITLYTQLEHIPECWLKDIGCLILDEVHMMCTPEAAGALLKTTPKYIIGCSATPEREDQLHLMAYSILGTKLYIIKNPTHVEVYRILTGFVPTMQNNRIGRTDWTVLINSLYENEARNTMIIDTIMKNYGTYKILVATSRKEYAKNLSEYLNSINIPSDYFVGSMRNCKDVRVLCGVYQKMGVGFDEKSSIIDYSGERVSLLIITFSIKNWRLLKQLVGRVMRSDHPIVMDLVDESSIHNRHWKEREKYYKSINSTVHTVDLRPPPPGDSVDSIIAFSMQRLNLGGK